MTTRNKWTRDAVIAILKQCKSKNELRKKYSGAFTAIKTHGWTDLYSLLPNRPYTNQLKWTQDAILEAIQTCSSRDEFRKRYDQAYEQMNRHGWRHLLNYISPANHKWTLSELETISRGYATRFQFRHENPLAYDAIRRNGWEDLVTGLPKRYNKTDEFSYEHIWDCAHKCSSRTEFNKKYRSESYAAKKRGIYDEIVADMPKQYKKAS